jgi:hypothetical protein
MGFDDTSALPIYPDRDAPLVIGGHVQPCRDTDEADDWYADGFD